METCHKSILEEKIEDFIEAICEEADYPGWFYDDLKKEMANASEAVFDASMKAQVFCRVYDES